MRPYLILSLFLFLICSLSTPAQEITAPEPVTGNLSGTVVDVEGGAIPGATVVLDGPAASDHATTQSNETGLFAFHGLRPAVSYHLTIQSPGFAALTPPAIVLTPGQQLDMGNVKLTIATVETSVTAKTTEQIATEQIQIQETQRLLGILPNFYVSYDPNPAPLTKKLKYQLSFRAATDVATFVGVGVLAGLEQAVDYPDYQQGAKGYGQRFGASYSDTFAGIMIGGAVLPALLHQDPRYFYQGTGTKKSRTLHALSSPFICRGDNGKKQLNISSIGGDLASGAISNIYYPASNRGPGLVFEGALISTAGRMANSVAQEFLYRRFTTHSSGTTP